MLANKVEVVDNIHGDPHLRLENGLKIVSNQIFIKDYDALLVASGRKYTDNYCNLFKPNEYITANGFDSHRKITEKLPKTKYLTILNLNLDSLKAASVIHKEFPDIKITIVDKRKSPVNLSSFYGPEIADSLLSEHKKNGIEFMLGQFPILVKDQPSTTSKRLYFKGHSLDSDLIISFPEKFKANNVILPSFQKFLKGTDSIENLLFANNGLVQTDYFTRTPHKRIFAAGDVASMGYFPTGGATKCASLGHAYTQGMFAAINILGLSVPMMYIPYSVGEHQETFVHCVGDHGIFHDVITRGDVKNLDFLAFYARGEKLVRVCGSQNRVKDVLTMSEAFRLNLTGDFEAWKNSILSIPDVEEAIEISERSGVFRDKIFELRNQPLDRDILWISRDSSYELEPTIEEKLERGE